MAAIFRKDEEKREAAVMQLPDPPPARRNLLQTALFFAAMIGFLVFSDWANPSQTIIEKTDGTKMQVAVLLETTETLRVQLEEPVGELKKGTKLTIPKSEIVKTEYATPEGYEWAELDLHASLVLRRSPAWRRRLLMVGTWFDTRGTVRVDGPDLGLRQVDHSAAVRRRVRHGLRRGADPRGSWWPRWVGGNSFQANLVASLIGAMWYFATLTEIPILEALLGLGMGRGPALALLLAGPALSLPSIAVIYSVIGFKKTAVFVGLTVVMSAVVGMVFGWFFV